MYLIGIILIILVLSVTLFALTLSLTFLLGPPFVPTPKKIIFEMFELSELNKKDLIVDLGSGDGAILIEAGLRGARAQGFEINPFLVLLTKIKIVLNGLSNKISVHASPYQQANLYDATIIFCYCLPRFIPAIEKKLNAELKQNAKIISYKFPMPNLKLVKSTSSGLFLYSLNK